MSIARYAKNVSTSNIKVPSPPSFRSDLAVMVRKCGFINSYMGAVLNLSSFLRYFIHLALALAPSCASQGFSAKSYPNTNLVYFAFHEACLAQVTFTIDRVFICRHLFPPFLNCCHNVLGSALCKL